MEGSRVGNGGTVSYFQVGEILKGSGNTANFGGIFGKSAFGVDVLWAMCRVRRRFWLMAGELGSILFGRFHMAGKTFFFQ